MYARINPYMATKSLLIAGLLGAFAPAAGCSRSPVSYGAPNSIIVVAAEPLWESVADTVSMVLEPPIFTVREERTFDLTYASPADPVWGSLRMWRQVLVIGEPGDAWVEPVLARADSVPTELPAFFEVRDVWARDQEVTIVLLPPGGGRTELIEILPEVHAYLDGRFRDYVLNRMFASGPNDELRQELETDAGFSLIVPRVYGHAEVDSVHIFRNDQQRREELIRSIVVSWRDGVPAEPVSADWVLAWRDSLSQALHEPVQTADRERFEVRQLNDGGLEVQGVWNTVSGEWPAAGPYMNRLVVCPDQDRTYLLDAWLYAPGQSKYEFMLQLQTVLDTFACGVT